GSVPLASSMSTATGSGASWRCLPAREPASNRQRPNDRDIEHGRRRDRAGGTAVRRISLRRFRSLARSWEGLGRTDPLFGILSDPAKWGGKWDADEFFASGRAHVEKLLRSLNDARASFKRDTCLDFGC